MPPTLALALTLGFIAWLFRRDIREKPEVTGALWLPVIWVFIVCSKTVSQWLSLFGISGFASTSMEEGSTLDALVLLGMIASGIYVLHRRQVRWSEFCRANPWLIAFILFCLISAAWSDSPYISVKRWIKILGHPIMVLVVFSEPDPVEALTRLMKRCAYVVFPISILWMKYFTVLGRRWDVGGGMQNRGITVGKNELGSVSIIFALFLFWHLLRIWKDSQQKKELWLTAGLLLLTAYCLQKAHSATSVVSLLTAGMVMVGVGLRFVDNRRIQAYAVTAIVLVLIAQGVFDIYGAVADLTGHASTLEGRGHLWSVLLQTDGHSILGAGYENYWSGVRREAIWAMPEFWWHPLQAHNGYLEIYLNLGLIGFAILIGLIVATFGKCRRELLENFEWGRLTLSYLLMVVLHNWTEAGFKGLSLMFFAFFLVAVNHRVLAACTAQRERTFTPEMAEQFAYENAV